MRSRSNLSTQRVFAWSGPVLVVFFFVGFWVVGGFVPPPTPEHTALQTAEWYQNGTVRIRLGLWITMFAATLFAPWTTAVAMQLKRIEGRYAPLAYCQFGLGMIFVLEFIFPLMFWQAAAFRPYDDPTHIQRLNDVGWLMFLGVVSTAVLQAVLIGMAAFRDQGDAPALPRWSGYFNFWMATLFLPGGFVVFFKSGPFAWNGLLAWWVLAAAFCAWVLTMSVLILRAVARQLRDEPEQRDQLVGVT